MIKINKITEKDVEFVSEWPTLDNYQTVAIKSAIYPGRGTSLGLIYVALKGAGEAGEFAENVGKAMRDDVLFSQVDDDVFIVESLTDERRRKLILELGDQLWYLAAKATELNIKLSDVAIMNLDKLCSRSERNKLQGSGDDR